MASPLAQASGTEHPVNDTIQAAAKDALEEVTSDEPAEPEIREHKGQFKALPG